MSAIAETSAIELDLDCDAAAWWPRWAAHVRAWLGQRSVCARDAVVVLSAAAHLPLARSAWAATGEGWLPRMGTAATLAAEAGGRQQGAGAPSGDASTDVLAARALLAQEEWGRAWRRRDRRGFELGVQRVLEAALAWSTRLAAIRPDARAAYVQQARALLTASAGVLARERMLALMGLEWAARTAVFRTDVLWRERPAACVVLDAAGGDAWLAAWSAGLDAAGVPLLRVRAASCDRNPGLTQAACVDFEDEAQRAAAQVFAQARHAAPVALIAQDRELVRRVRALLERGGLRVADETGWRLSTTRAGAALMAWLRASRTRSTAQQLLDAWLSGWGDCGELDARGRRELEARLARLRWGGLWDQPLPPSRDARDASPAADAWWACARDATAPLRWRGRLPLPQALERLQAALRALGTWAALEADAAGAQVLAAVHLVPAAADPAADAAWRDVCAATEVDADAFADWVDGCLEQATYTPASPPSAQVVITPAARAGLRPFGAVVWPGADDEHLSVPEAPMSWLGGRLLEELQLPGHRQQADRTWAALRLLLSGGPVHLSWRHADGDRLLQPSSLLQRWATEAGLGDLGGAAAAADARVPVRRDAAPTPAPLPQLDAPAAARLLPQRLSATAYEDLRACPYRFHARVLLGLREEEEIEEGVSKRDFGTWLHEVLRRFHAEETSAAGQDELPRLRSIAAELSAQEGWGDEQDGAGDFLLFAAAFERMAPLYLAWWQQQRARGVAIERMEAPVEARLESPPVVLYGQIDRLDRLPEEEAGGEAWRILDYKARSKARLQGQLKPPTEDTQMAFYAALLALSGLPGRIEASYLALEDREVSEVAHPEVEDSAQALLAGLASDLSRIADGEPLPALGEGPACEYCAARGLCRRDHWERQA